MILVSKSGQLKECSCSIAAVLVWAGSGDKGELWYNKQAKEKIIECVFVQCSQVL